MSDPEFVGSALGLDDPVLVPGNKIELLQNGDEYFPAMLTPMQSANSFVMHYVNAREPAWRCACFSTP